MLDRMPGITARRRHRSNHFVVQHHFPSRASARRPPAFLPVTVMVSSRPAHSQLDVDGDGAGAGQRQAVPHDPGEPGERVGHGVGARRQFGDPILPGPIGDGTCVPFRSGPNCSPRPSPPAAHRRTRRGRRQPAWFAHGRTQEGRRSREATANARLTSSRSSLSQESARGFVRRVGVSLVIGDILHRADVGPTMFRASVATL